MNLWEKIKALFVKAETAVEEVLTPFEHEFLQKLHPFVHQVATTLGSQGVKLVEDTLAAALASVVATGGNVGAAIAAAAATAIPELKADVDADKKNAVYGVLAVTQAAVTTAAGAPAPDAA